MGWRFLRPENIEKLVCNSPEAIPEKDRQDFTCALKDCISAILRINQAIPAYNAALQVQLEAAADSTYFEKQD